MIVRPSCASRCDPFGRRQPCHLRERPDERRDPPALGGPADPAKELGSSDAASPGGGSGSWRICFNSKGPSISKLGQHARQMAAATRRRNAGRRLTGAHQSQKRNSWLLWGDSIMESLRREAGWGNVRLSKTGCSLALNMRNGRSVVVRIMDRGPHVAGRAIDLSKAAAERLRFTHRGLAPVRIRVLNKPVRQRREAELTRRPKRMHREMARWADNRPVLQASGHQSAAFTRP